MTEELIQRFFKKECTAAESIQVSEYLKSHPELINKYLSEEEWNNIEEPAEMSEEFWNEAWANIRKKKRAGAVIIYFKRTVVAACIAALIVAGFYWHVQRERTNDVVLHPQAATITEPATKHKAITNRSGKMMSIPLEDNSLIKLSSNSELRYDTPFQKNKRDVWLRGEAYFKVAKDETKPFTVYAAGLSTTVLGTEFRITTNDKRHNIVVRLYKGKVLVQSATHSLKGWSKNIYLLPGEQMQYDTDKMLVAVEKIANAKNISLKRTALNPAAKKAEAVASHNLSFNSTSLSEVLKQLAKYFSAKIEFNEAEISAMSFTGKITKNDSLPTILRIIAQMNELEIIQEGDGFTVKKIE